jgi:hypothetical protein
MNFKKAGKEVGQFFKKGGQGERILKKAGKVAGQVGNVLSSNAGALTAINPELAVGAKVAGGLLKEASGIKNLKGGLEVAKKAQEASKQFV